jgi:hypothetical protein
VLLRYLVWAGMDTLGVRLPSCKSYHKRNWKFTTMFLRHLQYSVRRIHDLIVGRNAYQCRAFVPYLFYNFPDAVDLSQNSCLLVYPLNKLNISLLIFLPERTALFFRNKITIFFQEHEIIPHFGRATMVQLKDALLLQLPANLPCIAFHISESLERSESGKSETTFYEFFSFPFFRDI